MKSNFKKLLSLSSKQEALGVDNTHSDNLARLMNTKDSNAAKKIRSEMSNPLQKDQDSNLFQKMQSLQEKAEGIS